MFRYIFLFAILLSSCHKTESLSAPAALRINIGIDPQTLDPRKVRDLTGTTLLHMLFEGLTRTSKTGILEMALANDVEISEDRTQYLFHLRKSFWSNGDPVTSFDFATSWKTILDPRFPTDIASQLYVIKNGRPAKSGTIGLDQVGIQTPDPQTLIVQLEQPIPYFLELVSMTPFFPVSHKITDPNWALSPETYVCNGPFTLTAWKHSDRIRMTKNIHYWEAQKVRLNAIDLFMMSVDTEMRMFEEGKLDWAGSPLSTIPPEAICSLKAADQLCVNPFSATYFYRVNTADLVKGKKNPLSQPLFRKALALCIRRQEITGHLLQGGHTPAKGLVPPEMGLSEQGYFSDGDWTAARLLLAKALSELDLSLEALDPICISYRNNERNAVLAQAVQQQLTEGLGIAVALEAVEGKIFSQKVAEQDYQLAAGSWTADFNDPINFLEVFKCKDAGTNHTDWEHPKYIDLLNRSTLCTDSKERQRLLHEAEQVLMEQMPIIPIFHFTLNYLQSDQLQEVALSPLGQIDFRWAHLKDCR